MTFTQIQARIKAYAGLSSTEADTRIGISINAHYRRITSALGMNASRFVTRSVATTNGQQYVVFTEIEKIDRILDTTDATAIRLLQEVSIHTQRSTQPTDSDPTTWALRNTDADSVTVLLDTVPQSAYTLQADGWTTMSDLSGSDEPIFPESFHDILTWSVLAEELLKKEKLQIAAAYESKAKALLEELQFHLADSPTYATRQGESESTFTGSVAGGGGGNLGSTAYTQTSLLTFDLGAGVAPFAVARSDAAVVTNLDADKLDGQHGSYYLSRANHTSTELATAGLTVSATDRLLGRDTAGSGAVEEISLATSLEFSGSGSIRRSALTGDVTASAGSNATTIANDAVTYAKMQNISATSRILGRKTAAAGDAEECTLSDVLDFVGSAAQGDILYRGAATWERLAAGTSGQFLQTLGTGANPAWVDPVRVLDRDVTVTTVNTTTTETTVYSYTVPANTLGTTRALRLSLIGDAKNGSGGASNLTVRVKLGSTTIATAAKSLANSNNGGAQAVTCLISAGNATNAQRAFTQWYCGDADQNNDAGTLTIEGGSNQLFSGAHVAIAEDSTATLALAVTVQHSVSHADTEFRAHCVQVELL